ncbi:MAG: hypothetical protein CMI00_13770 [Oceanospirillaceae bacterium]|nr:hypothetical protein [Oceanospirillaceae bacterium]|tara:strand:- start:76541 stop:77014 length:474 start_codon:yes stop_codon:yes gene_type:complete
MSQAPAQHRLGQILINKKLITQEDLQRALAFQELHDCKLGEALVAMGAISHSGLRRALNQQRWLRNCATCIALLTPVSFSYAYEPVQYTSTLSGDDFPEYGRLPPSNPYAKNDSYVGDMLSAAWTLYRGQPEEGEWRYSVGRTDDKKGYELSVSLHF